MKISIPKLRWVADWLERDGVRICRLEEQGALQDVAEYLRFVADQREEFEARRRDPDERMEQLKSALQKVFSARGARAAGRTG